MMESLHFHHSTFDTCLLPLEQVLDELWVTNTENHDDLFVPFRHREQDGPKYSLTNMTRNQLIAHHQSDVPNLDHYEATTEPKFDQGAASYSLSKDAIGKSRLRTVFVNLGMLDSFPSSDWACGVVKRAVSPVRGTRG